IDHSIGEIFYGVSEFFPYRLKQQKENGGIKSHKMVDDFIARLKAQKGYYMPLWQMHLLYQALSAANAQGIDEAKDIWREFRRRSVEITPKINMQIEAEGSKSIRDMEISDVELFHISLGKVLKKYHIEERDFDRNVGIRSGVRRKYLDGTMLPLS